jgi:hypothetical protein
MAVQSLGDSYSSSFSQFVRKMDPTFVAGSMYRAYKPGTGADPEGVANLAHNGHFEIRRRKSSYSFGFGFQDNMHWTMATLFGQFIPIGSPSMTDEEKLAAVRRKYPSLVEAEPNEDGERTFCLPCCSGDKHGWHTAFGNNEIIVQHRVGG